VNTDKPSVLHTPAELKSANEAPPAVPTFENSAHPPIHLLNVSLTPDEFRIVFCANHAEVAVYQIIFDAQISSGDYTDIQESIVTLYRKESDGTRKVGIQFRAVGITHDGWLSDAPDHGELIIKDAPNNQKVIQSLAVASEGQISFTIEDCIKKAPGMSFLRLLHLMEGAGIGRPSTYSVTLKKLFKDSEVLAFDQPSDMVVLTPSGVELGARLETRCDYLSSADFANTFNMRLDDIASGILPSKEFLAWILSITHQDDPLADAAIVKLWDSVDDLRSDKVINTKEFGENGGYINCHTVK